LPLLVPVATTLSPYEGLAVKKTYRTSAPADGRPEKNYCFLLKIFKNEANQEHIQLVIIEKKKLKKI